MGNDGDRTQYLFDVHCIEQVLNQYAIGLDTLQIPLMERCFTEDAHIEIPGAGVVSRAAYAATCRENLARLDATHHQLGPATVEVTGDTARARCYLTAQHALDSLAPDGLLTIGAWYDDELLRTADGWKITRRVGTAVWCSGNPAVLGLPVQPGAFPKTPGRESPPWLARS